jgi:hypothetical protein
VANDFGDTDHWKLLAAAKRFLFGADVLRRSDQYSASSLLFTPTLHLTAHGIEVLLKANLVGSGLALDDVRRTHRHDVWSLWKHNTNRLLRDEVFSAARTAWDPAKSDPLWQDNFSEDPDQLLAEYLKRISDLHTSETDYDLRYVAAPGNDGTQASSSD